MFATASPVKPSVKIDKTSPTSNMLAIPVVHATLCSDVWAYMVAVWIGFGTLTPLLLGCPFPSSLALGGVTLFLGEHQSSASSIESGTSRLSKLVNQAQLVNEKHQLESDGCWEKCCARSLVFTAKRRGRISRYSAPSFSARRPSEPLPTLITLTRAAPCTSHLIFDGAMPLTRVERIPLPPRSQTIGTGHTPSGKGYHPRPKVRMCFPHSTHSTLFESPSSLETRFPQICYVS